MYMLLIIRSLCSHSFYDVQKKRFVLVVSLGREIIVKYTRANAA